MIGTNHGMYVAHLHFEIRKNLSIGINRSAFKRDFTNYYRPSEFIAARRKLPCGGRSAVIVTNTYSTGKIPLPPPDESPVHGHAKTAPEKPTPFNPPPQRKNTFRVNRFEDL